MGVQRRSESYSDSLAVLVVDEDPASGLVIETRLERFEARVQTAESGRQALQLFEVNRRQIVVTGVRVPDLDGGVLVANLRLLDEKVVVIDGDGAVLMRMGALAMIGPSACPNFLHIVLDNQSYESTGGQQSISHNVDFVAVAAACGYARARYVHCLDELSDAIGAWQASPRASFLHMKISDGSLANLGRPTVKPHEVKERFIDFLKG